MHLDSAFDEFRGTCHHVKHEITVQKSLKVLGFYGFMYASIVHIKPLSYSLRDIRHRNKQKRHCTSGARKLTTHALQAKALHTSNVSTYMSSSPIDGLAPSARPNGGTCVMSEEEQVEHAL